MGAQVRGVYPLGMSEEIRSTPEGGFTYANQLLIYSRNQSKGPGGELLATGRQSVVMDMNSFIWVSQRKLLGARFSMSATLPLANNSLESDVTGPISGGGGFADSYYSSVWAGTHNAARYARSTDSLLRPAVSTSERMTMSVRGTGHMRFLQDRRSICPGIRRQPSLSFRCTNCIRLKKARVFIRARP